jgi:ubiquinone/menaquinone biosynthesis C-methylase UbiE
MVSYVKKYVAFCSTSFGKQLMAIEANFLRRELTGRKKILDVGCGIGTFEERMPDFDITGVDIDEGTLDIARKRAPDADFYMANASKLPFPSFSYDAVFFVTSLEFMDDYKPAIDEAFRILKPNGKLVAMILNPESQYFQRHYVKKDSYFRRIKHRNPSEISDYFGGDFDISTHYFLGIDDKKIFNTSDKKFASLYVVVGTKFRF